MLGIYCPSQMDCNTYEQEKVIQAEQRGIQVIASKCFSDFMLKRKLIQTNGKTPAEVVKDLRENPLIVPVHYYYENSSVVGYRQPPWPDIYFNRKFHNNYGTCATASNAAHEWSHSIGYGHDFEATARRPYSVPYSINAASTACCPLAGARWMFGDESENLKNLENAEQ